MRKKNKAFMKSKLQIEICCGSYQDVLTACRYPIDRIELNSALSLGGLTPDFATFLKARAHTTLPIITMVRPREAGFCYSDTEKEIMTESAELFLKNGADGIAFGFLNPDNGIDEKTTCQMVELIHSYSKEAVFHRAFDETDDMDASIRTLIECKVDRVLTSGLKSTAWEGRVNLRRLIETYGDKIQILPGCGIQKDNILELLDTTNASAFHMTAKSYFKDHESYPAVSGKNIQEVLDRLKIHRTGYRREEDLPSADREMLVNDLFEDKNG